jgi:hypothetical protein
MISTITRWLLVVSAIAAVAVTPALSWAGLSGNHNEKLVRE